MLVCYLLLFHFPVPLRVMDLEGMYGIGAAMRSWVQIQHSIPIQMSVNVKTLVCL